MSISSITQTKTCTKCGGVFPATKEYFKPRKGSTDGFRNHCRGCVNKYNSQWYRETDRGEYYKSWKEQNNDHYREYHKEYYQSNRTHFNKKSAEWTTKNRSKHNQYVKKWQSNNHEKLRIYSSNRRARKLSAEGTYTIKDVRDQYKRQKGKCFWCGKKLNGVYHADHVIPLVRGGSNWPSNIVCSCAVCNQSKSDKLPHEWDGTDKLL
jgi:CRISPR/Cas system Type II protein with McrA/HNH and RuvC-like nuclease domain